jgi:hypothetical protein
MLGGLSAISNLLNLNWGHRLDILFLSETLENGHKLENIRVMLGSVSLFVGFFTV